MARAVARCASLAAVAVVTALAATPASGAARVKDCAAHIPPVIYNVTARGVSCRFARRYARRFNAHSRCSTRRCRFRGYTCRIRRDGVESRDYRCVRGAKVVRWQAGS
jgi:hypothetical protein